MNMLSHDQPQLPVQRKLIWALLAVSGIAIMMAVVDCARGVSTALNESRTDTSLAASHRLKLIAGCLIEYLERDNRLPASLADLKPCLERKDVRSAVDPWGTPVAYEQVVGEMSARRTMGFILWSYGPDRMPNTADDVTLDSVSGVAYGPR